MSLALFLENWLEYANGVHLQWLFIKGTTTARSTYEEQDKEANCGKEAYSRALKRAMNSPAFLMARADDDKLGSHSICKKSATMARERGCPKDDVDYRARWSAVKQMQDAYVDAQLTWPDVNCASRICFKGVCMYKVKSNAGLTDNWLCEHVTPQIAAIFGEKWSNLS